MRKIALGLTALAMSTALLLATQARAQQTPATPDTVPEQMPFDIPYGPSIGLEQAKAVAAAAEAEAKKHNWKLAITVVDPSGVLVYFEKIDGTQLASVAIAEHKARAAATFRRETKVFEDGIAAGNNYLITLDGLVASRGGIPLVEGGKLIGAIGCSGALGIQDWTACKAGAATVK